jgi:hypothetical protein
MNQITTIGQKIKLVEQEIIDIKEIISGVSFLEDKYAYLQFPNHPLQANLISLQPALTALIQQQTAGKSSLRLSYLKVLTLKILVFQLFNFNSTQLVSF